MRRLHEMESYLAALPQGLDSWADHTQKASIYRHLLDSMDLRPLVPHLPAPLSELITSPEVPNAWIPEVQASALYLAVYDGLFTGEQAFVNHWRQLHQKLYSGPLYRILMMVANPDRVLEGAQPRWGALHRGMGLSIERGPRAAEPRVARATISYPPGLVPRIVAKGLATSFWAVIEAAGGRDVAFREIEYTADHSTAEVQWR